jgi:hypothetical protein
MAVKGESVNALRVSVEGLYNCKSTFREIVHVSETLMGETVWDGDVYLFDLKDHPSAKLAYAWSSPVKDSEKRKFYAVLHARPVKSAQDAVRASIFSDLGW